MYEIKQRRACTSMIKGRNKVICLADRWHLSFVKELATDINMTINFINPVDNEYGVKIGNKWTGVVGLLAEGKADMSFSLLSFTPSRAKSIVFSIAMGFSSIRMYIAKPKTSTSYISFFDIFSIQYWIFLFCIVASISLAFL